MEKLLDSILEELDFEKVQIVDEGPAEPLKLSSDIQRVASMYARIKQQELREQSHPTYNSDGETVNTEQDDNELASLLDLSKGKLELILTDIPTIIAQQR